MKKEDILDRCIEVSAIIAVIQLMVFYSYGLVSFIVDVWRWIV